MTKPKSPPKPRRPGRPSATQPANQRELLLNAALALFAHQGIAGTTLNAIARHAHVTPALVHYYFENREKLLDAVIDERLIPVIDQLVAPIAVDPANPRAMILALAQRVIRMAAARPWMPPLWVREILNEGGQLRSVLLERARPKVIEPMRKLIKSAQAVGLINPELEPGLVMVSLIGLTIFPLAAAPIWQQLPGNKNISIDTLERHMLSLLAHGLEPAHAHTE